MRSLRGSDPSTSSQKMLCDSEILDQSHQELVHFEDNSLPSPISELWGSCFAAYPEFDCSSDNLSVSHSESSSDLNDLFVEHVYQKRVPIGPEFQAEIPPWRPSAQTSLGVACDKNSLPSCDAISINGQGKHACRLLGTCVWPLLGSNGVVNNQRIGQGRPATCSCPNQSSIACVKEHIREGREKLKLELGDAFYSWGFDDMGEGVSEQWTREEEQSFRELVNGNPISLNQNFWDHLTVAFPSRNRKELVSYYFNVFVLQRRGLQNRLNPENIDSDDDKTDMRDIEIEPYDCCLMTTSDDFGTEFNAREDKVFAIDMVEEGAADGSIPKFNSGHLLKLDMGHQKEDTGDVTGIHIPSPTQPFSL